MNQAFKALSDPTRREILFLLHKQDRTAGEIAQYFNISKPSLSHHLNVLKHADLVYDERRGQFMYYSIQTTVLQDVMNWLMNISTKNEK